MSRTTLIIITMVLVAATASAGTFDRAPYLAEQQIDVLNKRVANQQFARDLFGEPYATVVVGNVDVYDRFPYLEARYFQIVSDPVWNRLLMGEAGRGLFSYDGAQGEFGVLSSPRGLSSDGQDRIYVADTGNDRVLVFRTVTEYERINLEPVFAIDGLSKPHDVAYSDGGTPFDASDDRLYVANTGRNEVRGYSLTRGGARLTDSLGDLGSGVDHFAGPTAIAVGRHDGVNDDDVYVADAHNCRVVLLRDTGGTLQWAGEKQHDLGIITALDSDHWGNVYATAPRAGKVVKFTSSLSPVASLTGVDRPRSFHTLFANVTDHRTGERKRAGQGSGVVVEEWNGESGIRLVNLGVEVRDPAAVKGEAGAVRVTLTDHARVSAEITDPSSGRVVARHDAGVLSAGPQTIRFSSDDYVSDFERGEYRVTVHAASMYDGGAASEAGVDINMTSAGGPPLPARLTVLGNHPNPFNPTTSIRFVVPAGGDRDYDLRIYDVQGRLVRRLASGRIGSGLHEVPWNGRSENGGTVGSGIYFYRIKVGRESSTGKMVLIK